MRPAIHVPFDPPPPKRPKVIVPFRCDPDSAEWLRRFVGEPRPTISEIADWAVKLGRTYYEALHGPFAKKVEELARSEGVTEAQMLARLVEAGLGVYDRERKGKK